MEHPNAKFTRPYRLALLTIFILAFFIITPLIILSTAGYRYDWRYGLLKETGSISIDEIEPTNLTVYLNGLKLNGGMPFRLNNITPNKYQLKISAPGYYDWQKQIEVTTKQTVYIKQFSLLKKTEPKKIANGKIIDLALSYDGNYLVYLQENNNQQELWLLNNKLNNKILLLTAAPEPLQITWFSRNNYFIIANKESPYKTFVIFNALNPSLPVSAPAIIADKIIKFEWSDEADPVIYFNTRAGLFSYSLLTNRRNLLINNLAADWYFRQNQLWTISPTGSQNLIINQDVLGFKNTLKTLNFKTLLPKNNNLNWSIVAVQDNQILLKQNSGGGYLLTNSQNNFAINASNYYFSPHNAWWLFWNPWELWTYSAGEKPRLLNRSGEQLTQVVPLDKYNTLALVWKDRVTALFPYYYLSHDFINGQIKKIEPDTNKRTLFFSGAVNKQEGLWKLNY